MALDETQMSNNESDPSTDLDNQKLAPIPVENRIAELNRKFSKSHEAITGIEEKMNQLMSFINQAQAPAQTTQTDDPNVDSSTKSYIDARFQQMETRNVEKDYVSSFHSTMEAYPELDPKNEAYDSDFYKKADEYYKVFAATKQPDAPRKAADMAAIDMGKFEQIQRARLLADEVKRSRTLADGGMSPRGSMAAKPKAILSDSIKTLAQLMKQDPKDIEAFAKKNPIKYGIRG